jgi:hypothetical protein
VVGQEVNSPFRKKKLQFWSKVVELFMIHGSNTKTAALLGIDRKTVGDIIKRYHGCKCNGILIELSSKINKPENPED